jgi:cytidine deaminase
MYSSPTATLPAVGGQPSIFEEPMIIRTATPADAPQLARLNTAFNETDTPSDWIAARLSDPHTIETAVVAEINGRLVGFAGLRLISSPFYTSPSAELSELYVEPAYQRRGIGRALARYAEELARDKGVAEMVVVTNFDNLAALALYQSLGFRLDSDPALLKSLHQPASEPTAARLSPPYTALIAAARGIIAQRHKPDVHEVGAALVTRSGDFYAAVHLEAYVGRIAVCAEAIAIGMAAAAGDTDILAIVAVNQSGRIVAPCGMCRELISDYAPACQVILAEDRVVPVLELLPDKYHRESV